VKNHSTAQGSHLVPKSIGFIVEGIRLTFERHEPEGILLWSATFEEFLRNGQFTECEHLVVLAQGLSGRKKVCARCEARFQFAEGQFRERRNQSQDLREAERLYLQSSKEFDELLEKARKEVQLCRRRGNRSKAMLSAEATLKTSELDAALGHYQLGAFYFTHLKPKEAIQHYRTAARLRKKAGTLGDLALALIGLGEVHRVLSDFRRARSYFERAVRLDRGRKGAAYASATYALGALCLQRSQFKKAERWLKKCVGVSRKQKDSSRKAAALQQLAAVFQIQGRHREAENALDCACTVFQKLEDRVGMASVRHQQAAMMHQQAALHEEKSELERARDMYVGALTAWEDAGVKPGESQTHHQLGMLYHDLHEDGKARLHYARSLRIARSLRDYAGMTWTLYQIGRLHQDQGSQNYSEPKQRNCDYAKAERMYRASMNAATHVRDQRAQARALNQLGIMAQSVGKYDEAESCYQRSRAKCHAATDVSGEAEALYQIGAVYHLQGRVTESRRTLKKSIALARRVSDQESVAASLQLLNALGNA
jgi:tetratricopeptide (TPR) repeat protein